jgi:membrane protease YdiL (CAAX protease family)
MTFLNQLRWIFWNRDEKRLRALWRLGLHTAFFLTLNAFFLVVLLFIAVVFDTISGTNIQNVLAGLAPIEWMEASWIYWVLAPLATLLSIILATFLGSKWLDHRRFRSFGINLSKDWWVNFVFGLGLGAFLMAIIFLVGWLTGSLQVTGFFEVYGQGSSFLSGFIQGLIFFILVGIYEELLSRGYHLINLAEGLNSKFLGERWALILAYLISSVIFGLLHLDNPSATWVSTINIALAGVFLGLGMVLTGSLAIPIGLHITWNFFQGNVFGFAVSGINLGASVIGTEPIRHEWLIGNAFGPEAGVLSVIVMVLGGILTIVWVRRRHGLHLQTALAVYEPKDRQDTDINAF